MIVFNGVTLRGTPAERLQASFAGRSRRVGVQERQDPLHNYHFSPSYTRHCAKLT